MKTLEVKTAFIRALVSYCKLHGTDPEVLTQEDLRNFNEIFEAGYDAGEDDKRMEIQNAFFLMGVSMANDEMYTGPHSEEYLAIYNHGFERGARSNLQSNQIIEDLTKVAREWTPEKHVDGLTLHKELLDIYDMGQSHACTGPTNQYDVYDITSGDTTTSLGFNEMLEHPLVQDAGQVYEIWNLEVFGKLQLENILITRTS